ncbi:BLUF domain-containing protein (plasmid) [Cereibacter azotoformans]|uniref:FAD-dependent sensor of blue light n=1 Tax=Cereibacter azotoformans TaxID=43057 RepID=A0A2T5JSY8_9RHOB|nr:MULTISPECIES: BLUF domain-containing protein [Cereibacter]AXQ96151.1 blue light sensor protein [Cereibacter sphaeroides]PTR12520.1 FAD-dependent sensor of blue light [Cereibacter azotoformans]UIJ32991.1 BLUF domain-containing protein [Cereibacter azotoformans]
MSGELISLTYRSRARLSDPEEDILSIIRMSRVMNPRFGITGILFYDGFHFVQILEGPRSGCNEMFSCISRDARHEDIVTFGMFEIERRRFPDWSMRLVSRRELHALVPELDLLDVGEREEIARVHAGIVRRLAPAEPGVDRAG